MAATFKPKGNMLDFAQAPTKTYRLVMLICAVVHLAYAGIFFFAHCYILAAFNFLSVGMYLYLAVGKKGEFSTFQAVSVFFEVCVHIVLATILLGWEFGIHLQLLSLVALSFYFPFKNKRTPFFFGGAAGVLFIALYCYCMVRAPLYPATFTPPFQDFIHLFNIVVALIPLYVFSSFYTQTSKESVTRLSEKNDSLRQLANLDPLTGLFNRRYMYAKMDKAFADYEEMGRNFSVIISDIDDFKNVNDTYGHDCGDLVLKAIPAALRSCLREGDAICRWGGEEILILIENSTFENALRIGQSLKSAIEKMRVSFNDIEIGVTMTFGVSSTPAQSIAEMVSEADCNLYTGKRSGKNCVIGSPVIQTQKIG